MNMDIVLFLTGFAIGMVAGDFILRHRLNKAIDRLNNIGDVWGARIIKQIRDGE